MPRRSQEMWRILSRPEKKKENGRINTVITNQYRVVGLEEKKLKVIL